MIGYRRAALRLHGLSDSDRAWILRSLSEGQRVEIGRLLAELKQMGVPKDNSWLPGFVDVLPQGQREMDADDPAMRLVSVLSDASIDRINLLLADEPDVVVAAVLNCHAWKWRKNFTDSLSPSKCVVIDTLQPSKWPSRLRDAILEEVVRKYLGIERTNSPRAGNSSGKARAKKVRWFPFARKSSWQP